MWVNLIWILTVCQIFDAGKAMLCLRMKWAHCALTTEKFCRWKLGGQRDYSNLHLYHPLRSTFCPFDIFISNTGANWNRSHGSK